MSDREFAEQINTLIDEYGLPRRTPPTGRGAAAGGRITAGVSSDGRLDDLRVDPAMNTDDLAGLVEGIREAVNAAVDDLQAHLRAGVEELDGPVGGLDRAWERIVAQARSEAHQSTP